MSQTYEIFKQTILHTVFHTNILSIIIPLVIPSILTVVSNFPNVMFTTTLTQRKIYQMVFMTINFVSYVICLALLFYSDFFIWGGSHNKWHTFESLSQVYPFF